MTIIDDPQLPFRMDAYPIERHVITTQPSFRGAMDLSLALCKFVSDKQAAAKIGVDAGAYSCKKNGSKPWAIEEVRRVMEIGQNLIPLSWMAQQYGHGLVLLETEAERRDRGSRERIAELEFKNRVLTDALRGVSA
jgi:hypothetical protein